MNSVLLSSDKNDWGTPSVIRDAVFEFAGPANVVDPCPGSTPVGGPCPFEDGLTEPWPKGRVIYTNPPYGRAVKYWVSKCAAEGSEGREIVLLVTARPDTQWFHQALHTSDRTCFIRGRLTFLGASSTAPFPSAVFYWGDRQDRFVSVFGRLGNVVVPISGGDV